MERQVEHRYCGFQPGKMEVVGYSWAVRQKNHAEALADTWYFLPCLRQELEESEEGYRWMRRSWMKCESVCSNDDGAQSTLRLFQQITCQDFLYLYS